MDFFQKFKKINPIARCREYNISPWQCPQFLFLFLGMINIIGCILAYLFGSRYIEDPRLVALVILFWACFLLVLSYIITRNLEDFLKIQKLREEFIEIVSHQLRAPVTNIKWTLEYLEEKNHQALTNFESYLEILKENTKRMENLINDLVVLNKVREKAFLKNKIETDINSFIKKIIQTFQPFAQASNIEIHCCLPSNPLKASISPDALKILVENLIDNAIKYNKSGGKVKITVTKKGKKLLIKVEDTGIGISENEKPFIFEKFFRGRKAFQKNPQGSGLGLHIAREIVQSLGGKIKFFSKQNKGTTFIVYFPIN